jgi:hypothetical protein
MTDPVTEAPVRYQFTSVPQGVQLEIWELAPSYVQSDKPFLFRVKYLLPSRREAESALEEYLRNNDLDFAADDIPPEAESGHRRLISNRGTRP